MTRPDLRRGETPDRLENALEAAGFGTFVWDMASDTFTVSRRMAAITGLPEGRSAAGGGDALNNHVHPDDLAGMIAQRDQSRATGLPYDLEFRHIRPDNGEIVWLRLAGVRARDAEGRPEGIVGIVEDISARKLEESQRLTLMAELDHRVKNVLATVQALAVQTARRTTSLDAFLQNFHGRLRAMGSANELLTAARWRGAAIEHLAAAELGALAPGQTSWEGPELFLTARAANALSLGLHELATNALKFGALSTEAGRVKVTWKRLAPGGFELKWEESGGPSVAPPTHRGFGATLLEQVTSRELNGHTDIAYRPSGVVAILTAAATALAPRPDRVPHTAIARSADAEPPSGAASNLNGARVLIVEDAVLLALELETGLSEAGAVVVGPAYELEEAMGLLDRPIDAAVLDASLNGKSVTPVAAALTARGVPFVFATGYGEAGGAPGGFDAPVIRKPYDVTQVVSAIAGLLAPR